MKEQKQRMYKGAKTWGVFVGCKFDCAYCVPTFKRQAKRQKQNCPKCYGFGPHSHEERLARIPSADIIFIAGYGDISFCPPKDTRKIIEAIKKHNAKCPHKVYYLQSKRPEYFEQFLTELPDNVILVTTLETNRDYGYEHISKAPPPSERYRQFMALDYSRKVVTIEPVMDFDLDVFTEWIRKINPECVWVGFNSHPKSVKLPEPSNEKLVALLDNIDGMGIEVRTKDLRGIEWEPMVRCKPEEVGS